MEFLQDLVDLIASIPSEFWASLIGGGLAFSGVWLSNRDAMKRMRQQMVIEVEERRHDANLAMRRDVFFEASAGLISLSSVLGEIANIEKPFGTEAEMYQRSAASIARISLVATPETLELLAKAQMRFIEAFFDLIRRKANIVVVKNQLDNIIQLLNSELLSPVEISEQTEIKLSLESKKIDLTLRISVAASEHGVEFAKLLIPIQAAARKEMGLPAEEARLRSIAEGGIAKVQEMSRELNTHFREMVESAGVVLSDASRMSAAAKDNRRSCAGWLLIGYS